VFIPGAFSLIKVATGYGCVFYVAGLRNGFTLFLSMLYANSMARYTYQAVYDTAPGLVVRWEFLVRLAEFSTYFIGSISFIVLHQHIYVSLMITE